MRTAAAGLVLVLVSSPAYAHHERAIVELAQGLGFWIPVGVLAVLGLVDRLRFWWRDGARVSFTVGRFYVYGSRALSGARLPWRVQVQRF